MTPCPLLPFLLPLLWVTLTHANCPNTQQCRCDNEDQGLTLYCRGQDLSIVPEFSDTALQFYEVTLADNQITSVPDDAFKTPNGQGLITQVLDISENPITYIEDNAFSGLEETVTVLKLHVSNMNTFPTTAIRKLTKLRELHLKGFSVSSLPTGALQSLNQLQILSMDSCGLEQLASSDFTDQVDSLLEVDLPGNKFPSVPSTGLAPLKHMSKLNLARNLITQIDGDTFANMDSIEELNLEQNGINAIAENAFRGATDTLRRLDLGNNNNGLVESDLVPVKDLNNLEELDLSYNTLSSLPDNFFQNMQRLQYFSIQNNNFQGLSPGLFAGLGSSVREVNCMENSITSIPDGCFASLTGLQTLRLDRNSLAGTYSLDTFRGLENTLTYLSLMDTGFTESHWNALWKLESLQTLDLEDNQIGAVPENTFLSYQSLTLLDLKKNNIQSLSQRSFMGLQNSLKRILLDNNGISTLSECVFYKFNLEEIQLRSNPLLCDCQAKWLHQWIQDHSPLTNLWTCQAPAKHAGKYLKNIPEEELKCEETPPVEECEEYTTTSTTTSAPTQDVTTGLTYPIHLNVTATTPTSLQLLWRIFNVQGVSGWRVTCSKLETGEVVYNEWLAVSVRETVISDLTPSTEYFVCVTPEGSSTLQRTCINEMTSPDPGSVISPTEKTLIILGAVLAVVVVLAVIIVALVCYFRWRNRHAHPKFKEPSMQSQSNPELPQVSDQSKRFSKAKAHSLGNLNSASTMELDRRLDGFTPDERNRILQIFSNTGASTLSMLSTTSQRYTQEPYGRGRPGYLNPMEVSQELGRLDSGEYQEIPADTYDEIPLDKAGEDTYNEPFEERPRSTGDILGGASNYI